MRKFFMPFFLSVSLLFLGCEPNDSENSNTSDNEFQQNFGSSVSRSFIGQVVDTDNNPLQNVAVTIGSLTVQTDVNGVFMINNADVKEKFAYIKAKKVGFIDGSRAMVPTSGKNNVKIMMIPSTPVQVISSGTTSEVELGTGTKVVFDGAFEDENGTPYSGDVAVSMFHLTASNDDIGVLMPGSLYAKGEDGNEKVLQTFGMLNVELRGSSGQKLQIANGHTAEMTMLIDNSQLATAPQSIPLWHFDEANGYWKQEGSATKQGNKYVGEVSHFSWWNCDTFASITTLTINVTYSDGNPAANTGVQLIVPATGFTSYTLHTDSNGQISGQIPANATLTMNVFNACGDIVSTSTIGPFTSDTTIPVTINSSVESTLISGNLVQCNNTPVTNGYLVMDYGTYSTIVPVTNGAFSFQSLVCDTSNQIVIQGYDVDNVQMSLEAQYVLALPTTNIGTITTCLTSAEFISYQIDGGAIINLLQDVQGYADGTYLSINGASNGSPVPDFMISGNGIIPGLYTYPDYSIYIGGTTLQGNGEIQTPNTIQFNLTNFGPVGSSIEMTFNGAYTDSLGVNHTVNGAARALREF